MNSIKHINWSPLDYVEADVVAREAGEELLSRLEWLMIQPRVIVDAGCGPGTGSVRLQQHYPHARVLSIDFSMAMLAHARAQPTQVTCVCAAAEQLPLATQSVDLLFANLLLPWHSNVPSLLREWRRVLRPEGVLVLTALGPDTLKEYQKLWREHGLPDLLDIHKMGDWLLEEKFIDPVLDVNYYTVTYGNKTKLFHELHASGMLTLDVNGETRDEVVPAVDGRFAITYEVIFAHAFVPAEKGEVSASADGIVRVPMAHLRNALLSKYR